MTRMHEGGQIILKSGVKPKLESLTLSQWSIASLALYSGWRGEDRWKQHVRLSIIYHKDYIVYSALRECIDIFLGQVISKTPGMSCLSHTSIQCNWGLV